MHLIRRNAFPLQNLPAEFGCPVKAGKYEIYYNVSQRTMLDELMVNSVVVHYFNKMRVLEFAKTMRDDLRMNENQPLYRLMQKQCPQTESKILKLSLIHI